MTYIPVIKSKYKYYETSIQSKIVMEHPIKMQDFLIENFAFRIG